MDKVRTVIASQKAAQFNTYVGPNTTGKVLWYDVIDAMGIIKGDNGKEYLFSCGRFGHIGQYTSNYVIEDGLDATKSGTRVKFNPVQDLACNIRSE